MRFSALIFLPILLLAGCTTAADDSFNSDGSCDGVRVVVDFALLQESNIDNCVAIEGQSANALDVLLDAGVVTQGTLAYGDQVICRVNDLPSKSEPFTVAGEQPYLESCQDMPPAFAYWALWVINDSAVGWEYAMEGVSSLKLQKGQSIGMAFSTGGLTPNPDGN